MCQPDWDIDTALKRQPEKLKFPHSKDQPAQLSPAAARSPAGPRPLTAERPTVFCSAGSLLSDSKTNKS